MIDMEKGWIIRTKCNNPNHSDERHSFVPGVCGVLVDTEMFPNCDFVGHTYGDTCICKPTPRESGLLLHNALDGRV